jgi:hypothetical protein
VKDVIARLGTYCWQTWVRARDVRHRERLQHELFTAALTSRNATQRIHSSNKRYTRLRAANDAASRSYTFCVGYWRPGTSWQPPGLLHEKLRNREAVCTSVWVVESQPLVASDLIEEKLRLRPNDAHNLEKVGIERRLVTEHRSWQRWGERSFCSRRQVPDTLRVRRIW